VLVYFAPVMRVHQVVRVFNMFRRHRYFPLLISRSVFSDSSHS